MYYKDKDKKFYITGEISFKWLFFDSIAKPYLEPNQKAMVELFLKNSQRLLAVNFSRKKAPL